MEETAEELLDILDVETAVLTGEITRTMKDDPRGTRYVITGNAADGRTQVGIVGRFVAVDRVLIVTVYEVS